MKESSCTVSWVWEALHTGNKLLLSPVRKKSRPHTKTQPAITSRKQINHASTREPFLRSYPQFLSAQWKPTELDRHGRMVTAKITLFASGLV